MLNSHPNPVTRGAGFRLAALLAIRLGGPVHAAPPTSADDNWDDRFAVSGLKDFDEGGLGGRAMLYRADGL